MGYVSKRIRSWVEHPVTRLGLGCILFSSGLLETYQSFSDDLAQGHIGAHHGIMIFGLVNMFATIPDIIEGVAIGADYLEHLEAKRKKSPNE